MGQETLGKVRDGWGTPRGGSVQVRGPTKRSGTGRGTLGVRDGLGDTRGGLGRVGEPSERSGMDRVILGEVRDGSGDHP